MRWLPFLRRGRIDREIRDELAAHLLIGFALSVAVALLFRSILIGVTPTDPITYIGVFTLLTIASILASYLPAWRAGRVNVIEALRQE